MSCIPKVINSVWDRGSSRATFLIIRTAIRRTVSLSQAQKCVHILASWSIPHVNEITGVSSVWILNTAVQLLNIYRTFYIRLTLEKKMGMQTGSSFSLTSSTYSL